MQGWETEIVAVLVSSCMLPHFKTLLPPLKLMTEKRPAANLGKEGLGMKSLLGEVEVATPSPLPPPRPPFPALVTGSPVCPVLLLRGNWSKREEHCQ